MYARSTHVDADPAKVDAGIAFVRDRVMPALAEMDGFVGLSMLADRGSGRCIAAAAWRDREALDASAAGVAPLRERGAAVFGGRPTVAEWEIALLHRARASSEGAATRVTWCTFDPSGLDRAVDTFSMAMLPRLDDLPGFCSTSVMVDRSSGRAAIAATYADRAGLEASRPKVEAMRREFVEATGGEVTEVAEFDLALAHLRVPETV